MPHNAGAIRAPVAFQQYRGEAGLSQCGHNCRWNFGTLGFGAAAGAVMYDLYRNGLMGWVGRLVPGLNPDFEGIRWAKPLEPGQAPHLEGNPGQDSPLSGIDSDDEAVSDIEILGDDGWHNLKQAQMQGACNTAAGRCQVPKSNFRPGAAPLQASVRIASGSISSKGALLALRKSFPICMKCMVMCQSCSLPSSGVGGVACKKKPREMPQHARQAERGCCG